MMDLLVLTILAGLATFRAATLVTADEGPFSALLWLRVKAGAYNYDESGSAKTALGRFAGCAYCIGLWLALPGAGLVYWSLGRALDWSFVVVWLAVGGVQQFLQALTRRGES